MNLAIRKRRISHLDLYELTIKRGIASAGRSNLHLGTGTCSRKQGIPFGGRGHTTDLFQNKKIAAIDESARRFLRADHCLFNACALKRGVSLPKNPVAACGNGVLYRNAGSQSVTPSLSTIRFADAGSGKTGAAFAALSGIAFVSVSCAGAFFEPRFSAQINRIRSWSRSCCRPPSRYR